MAEAKVKKAKEAAVKKPAAKKTTKAEKPVEKEVIDGNIPQSSETTAQAAEEQEVKTAKAGKHSAKALKETEEKEAKEERKTHANEDQQDEKPKVAQKPARTRLERRSKNYRKLAEQIEKDKFYELAEALELATKTSPVKFDASVELHLRLGVDPRQADQNIRDIVVLPAGTGKTVRVAVFGEADTVELAKKAGADIAGGDEFLQKLDKGVIEFDVLVTQPSQMAKLAKYARILGPKGLMPNPKSGTVTNDIKKAVTEAKAGRVEYRVDSTGIVHLSIGKVSFGKAKLTENANAVLTSIKAARPGGLKGNYIKSLFVTTSMGPSIPVSTSNM